jgi:hypothetical protein
MKPPPDPPEGPKPPVKLSPACPSCGRKDIIVFPTFYSADGQPSKKARQVCAGCAPRLKRLGTSKGGDSGSDDFVAHVERVKPPAGDGKPPPKGKS